jgi:hypothetical protein
MSNANILTILLPRVKILRRGQKITSSIVIFNPGNATWFDVGKKQAVNHTVFNLSNQLKLNDFRIRWGTLPNKTDRKFTAVGRWFGMRSSAHNHVVYKNQIVKADIQIQSRKFATKGWHILKFEPVVQESGIRQPSIGIKRIFVYVRGSESYLQKYISAVKIYFRRPGRIHSAWSNSLYETLEPSEFSQRIPVIMALWQRIPMLERIAGSLQMQKDAKPILYLWNNNLAEKDRINKIVSKLQIPVMVLHSQTNIGGFGRFFLAREVQSKHRFIIFIDDDQVPTRTYLSDVIQEYQSRHISSQWAYQFPNSVNYWHKVLPEKGGLADYCGTGGMIADSTIFTKKAVFLCPKRYWFVEDLWLSYVAYQLGWKLTRSNTDLEILQDGLDQFSSLIDTKTSMLKYLHRRDKSWPTQISNRLEEN